MRRSIRVLVSLVAALIAGAAAAQSAPGADPFGEKVREYILTNPGVIREALKLLVAEELQGKERAMRQALAIHSEFLFKDPEAPVAGNPNGDVTVVAFLDYRCPHCRRAAPALEELVKRDPNVRLVYREYPILGPESVNAARYALAAQRQGKYAEMHRALLETDRFEPQAVAALAQRVGLDQQRLDSDINDRALLDSLERNIAVAQQIGVTGTPAFIVGERLVPGAAAVEVLLSHVAQARNQGSRK